MSNTDAMVLCIPINQIHTIHIYIPRIFPQGFDKKEGGGIELISHIISRQLQIPVSVLMGANLASEVAEEMFCETTIGKATRF